MEITDTKQMSEGRKDSGVPGIMHGIFQEFPDGMVFDNPWSIHSKIIAFLLISVVLLIFYYISPIIELNLIK